MRKLFLIAIVLAGVGLGCYRLPSTGKDASATPSDMAKICKPCGDTCTPSIWGVCESGCCVCRPPDGGVCPSL